jgi:hypothetical protein
MAQYIFADAPQQQRYWAIYATFSSRLQALFFPALQGREERAFWSIALGGSQVKRWVRGFTETPAGGETQQQQSQTDDS